MPDLVELLLPRTDGGVLVQAGTAAVAFGASSIRFRRDRDALILLAGLSMVTLAWFALRAAH